MNMEDCQHPVLFLDSVLHCRPGENGVLRWSVVNPDSTGLTDVRVSAVLEGAGLSLAWQGGGGRSAATGVTYRHPGFQGTWRIRAVRTHCAPGLQRQFRQAPVYKSWQTLLLHFKNSSDLHAPTVEINADDVALLRVDELVSQIGNGTLKLNLKDAAVLRWLKDRQSDDTENG